MRIVLALAALLAASSVHAAQPAKPAQGPLEYAIVAGGCFWCTEADLEKLPGVIGAVSGYTGGAEADPSYQQVAGGRTGHLEAVRVVYDPKRITYDQLLRKFWPTIDPTDAGGQFCDRGKTYETAVFVRNDAQRRAAEQTKAEAAKRLGRPVITPLRPEMKFWPAEGYHQDYAEKNALRYKLYRQGCGRDARLKALWDGR
jgi:peptide-methionine (S)-S-oxide reductase